MTGPPAPGKSTLATALAAELALPLLAKDTIKAGLVEALAVVDPAQDEGAGASEPKATRDLRREPAIG